LVDDRIVCEHRDAGAPLTFRGLETSFKLDTRFGVSQARSQAPTSCETHSRKIE